MSTKLLHTSYLDISKQNSDQIAVIYDNDEEGGEEPKRLSYPQLIQFADQVTTALRHNDCGDIIAISCYICLKLPAILLGIVKKPTAFCYISPRDLAKPELCGTILEKVDSLLLESDLLKHDWIENYFEILDTSGVLDLVLLKRKYGPGKPDLPSTRDSELAYVVTTSGSTGQSKVVYVPHQCIVPNITDLSTRFAITNKDRIYLASPLTFDPSIVEIFLALSNGATLVLTPESVKLDTERLVGVLVRHGVTILQATPTFLRRISPDLSQRTLLSDVTKLRLLILGGEKCPSWAELRRFRSVENKTELWNIYGVTEMSCWASVHRITESDEDEVPLGEALSETTLLVRDEEGHLLEEGDGILYLESTTRSCFHTGGNSGESASEVCTGDLVSLTTKKEVGRKRRIYYRGRRDFQVKRNGKRIDMHGIEELLRAHPDVHDVAVLLLSNVLVAFVHYHFITASIDTTVLKTFVNGRVPTHAQLDQVVRVDYLPMNKHGKIDRKKLQAALLPSTTNGSSEYDDTVFDHLLRDYFSLKTPPDPESTFVQLGGDSIGAVHFAKIIEETFGSELPQLVDLLLTKNLHFVKMRLRNEIFKSDEINSSQKRKGDEERFGESTFQPKKRNECALSSPVTITSVSRCNQIRTLGSRGATQVGKSEKIQSEFSEKKRNCRLDLLWSHDTGKCVDASPLVVNEGERTTVYIGSHSYRFVCLDDSGHVIWCTKLGGRVESSACLSTCGQHVVVGCYDHHVYFMDRRTGSIVWRFPTDEEVKSSPCTDDVTGYVIVGSHDHYLYALDLENRNCSWRVDIDGSSIFSSPCVCNESRQVYAATLAGSIAALNPLSGGIKWRHSLGKPVFSSPVCDRNTVVFGCVDGVIHTFSHSGNKLHRYRTDGSVFSSPTILPLPYDASPAPVTSSSEIMTSSNVRMTSNVICGSHDHHLYCFTEGTLKWRTKLDNIVYSSPFVGQFSSNQNLVFISSTRTLYIVDQSGMVLHTISLPGEVFSSPVVNGNLLFIGCRDDFIYCYAIIAK